MHICALLLLLAPLLVQAEQPWSDDTAEGWFQRRSLDAWHEHYDERCEQADLLACTTQRELISGALTQPQALALLERELGPLCEAGDPLACQALGAALFMRRDDDRAVARGDERMERACILGAHRACRGYGAFLLDAAEYDAEPQLPSDALRHGCERGDASSCLLLAKLQLEFLGDNTAASSSLDQACGLGDPMACAWEGFLEKGADHRDATLGTGATVLNKPCKKGDADACADRGLLSEIGMYGVPSPAKARPYYERGCELGDAVACHRLGLQLAQGLGGSADPARALSLLTLSCSKGVAAACHVQVAHTEGATASADAVTTLKRGCDAHSAQACAALGERLHAGSDPSQALPVMATACAAGHAEACLFLAEHHPSTSVTERILLGQHACLAGDPTGCHLGALAQLAPGSALREPASAVRLLAWPCQQGDLPSCSCVRGLAGIELEGAPPPAASCAAVDPLGDCSGDQAEACAELGLLLTHGKVAPLGEHPVAGEALIERGCQQGHPGACHQLAWTWLTGRGVTHDPQQAAVLLEEGCGHGWAHDCALLGALYHVDIGVSFDPDRAQQLLERACELGHTRSCRGHWMLNSL